MKRIALLGALLVAAVASAKPWHGLQPGLATRDDVVKAFGEPSKALVQKDKEILGYFGPKKIAGTQQAQFRIDAASKILERIDVFPPTGIQTDKVIESYGPECPEGMQPETPCFVLKITDDHKAYMHYVQLGLAVFLKADGQTVQSLVFTPDKK